MMLMKPKSLFHSVAMAAVILGVTFTVMLIWDLAYLPWGLGFLLCGGLMFLHMRRKRQLADQLLSKGRRVAARIVRIKRHTTANLSFSSSRGRAAARSPWTVYCEYDLAGKTYSIRTEYLWKQPSPNSPDLTVALDPAAPQRAVVDTQTLRYVAPGF